MSGQIAGPSMFSIELIVALIVGVSMIAGAVDLIRQPGWAWKSAEENKLAYLVLVGAGPDRGPRSCTSSWPVPRSSAIAAAGEAASLPFERFGETETKLRDDEHPARRALAESERIAPPRSGFEPSAPVAPRRRAEPPTVGAIRPRL